MDHENSLYEIPKYHALLQKQLLRTNSNFVGWQRWLKQEEALE